MYVGTFDVIHRCCWGSETSKELAKKNLCLKVFLKDISEKSYEIFAFCRRENNKLPTQAELNSAISILNAHPTVQKCELVKKDFGLRFGLLNLTIVDAVGKQGIIRTISEIDDVYLLKLFSTWVFEDGVEKYWMVVKDPTSYTEVLDALKNDADIDIICNELIDISTQNTKNFPNVFSTAIEVLDINESIKTDLSFLMEELTFKSVDTQEVKEVDMENVLDTIDEHEKTTELKNLVMRLLIEIFLNGLLANK